MGDLKSIAKEFADFVADDDLINELAIAFMDELEIDAIIKKADDIYRRLSP